MHRPAVEKSLNDGIQHTYKFSNGLSVSAIKGPYTYGGAVDEWEIAVLTSEGEWFTREVFGDADDDVIGYIPNSKLQNYLNKVDEYGS